MTTQTLTKIRRYAAKGLTNSQIAMRVGWKADQVDVALWVLLGRSEARANARLFWKVQRGENGC